MHNQPPRVFISYRHEDTNRPLVRQFADKLRKDSIDCHLDQYDEIPPPDEGWPEWMVRQIEQADYVVVVCTEGYYRSFRKMNGPGVGCGAVWEGAVITQELYASSGRNSKFVPVGWGSHGRNVGSVPECLRSTNYYDLLDGDGYGRLLQHLKSKRRAEQGDAGSAMCWNLPDRNRLFCSRDDILSILQSKLESSGRVAVSGMPGVGKTQLAAEYAHRHKGDYAHIFWVVADSEDGIRSSYVQIAQLLNLIASVNATESAAVSELMRWFGNTKGWLLVLDNADHLDAIKSFVPNDGAGSVLMTTRQWATGSLAEAVHLLEMSEEESAQFLLRRAGLLGWEQSLTDAIRCERDAALALISALGRLPLAIDQAAAYIEETGASPRSYLDELEKHPFDLLSRKSKSAGSAPVTATLLLALDRLEESDLPAGDLLRICAFLHVDAIPENLLREAAKAFGGAIGSAASDEIRWRETVATALHYSLVRVDRESQSLALHRLLQRVVQDSLSEAERIEYAVMVVKALSQLIPDNRFDRWPVLWELLPHAQVCAQHISNLNIRSLDSGCLLHRLGMFRHQMGMHAEAIRLYEQSLCILKDVVGAPSARVVALHESLGVAYRIYGRLTDAECHFLQAIAEQREIDPTSIEMARVLDGLGLLRKLQGECSQAEEILREALRVKERAIGDDRRTRRIGSSYYYLASVMDDQGHHQEAEKLYRRAITIRAACSGPDDPETLGAKNGLARLMIAQERYAEAEQLMEFILECRVRQFGLEHPSTAMSQSDKALLKAGLGSYAQAKELHTRALASICASLGSHHPYAATVSYRLGVLHIAMSQHGDAVPFLKQAVTVRNDLFGATHPETLAAQEAFAAALDHSR